ncbi:hypothetical protein [Chelatococcus reniformis]|nr:hypothetical protein [Chelatococcus reniformis]
MTMWVRLVLIGALTALAACNAGKVRPEGVLPKESLPTPPSEPRAAQYLPKQRPDSTPAAVQVPQQPAKRIEVPR